MYVLGWNDEWKKLIEVNLVFINLMIISIVDMMYKLDNFIMEIICL